MSALFYTVEHLVSRGKRQWEFMGFDPRKRTVSLRFGLAGTFDFSLASGQGRDDAANWAIVAADLDKVRNLAACSFDPGARTEPVANTRPTRQLRRPSGPEVRRG